MSPTFSRAPISYFLWAVMPIDFWGLRSGIRARALFARSSQAFTFRAAIFPSTAGEFPTPHRWESGAWLTLQLLGTADRTLTFFIPVFWSAFWHILKHIYSKFTILVNKKITLCTDIWRPELPNIISLVCWQKISPFMFKPRHKPGFQAVQNVS